MNRIMRIVLVLIGTLILAQFINMIAAFAIGLAVLVVWVLLDSRKQIREAGILGLGLSSEEAQAIQNDLSSGNRSSAVQRLQEAQERKLASLLE